MRPERTRFTFLSKMGGAPTPKMESHWFSPTAMSVLCSSWCGTSPFWAPEGGPIYPQRSQMELVLLTWLRVSASSASTPESTFHGIKHKGVDADENSGLFFARLKPRAYNGEFITATAGFRKVGWFKIGDLLVYLGNRPPFGGC